MMVSLSVMKVFEIRNKTVKRKTAGYDKYI